MNTNENNRHVGRPPKPEPERLVHRSIGLLPSEWEELRRIAFEERCSVAELVRRIVRLNRLKSL